MSLDTALFEETILDKAMRFQNGLIAAATGSSFDGGDIVYKELRLLFASNVDTKPKLPDFVRRCSDTAQFWGYIKYAYISYAERRKFIWDSFRPLIEYLETQDRTPAVGVISGTLEEFDPEHVHSVWQKALDRRVDDPEGAITAARSLVETVCKYILDDLGIDSSNHDLPKLWALVAEQLNLAPHQHEEAVFKAILGNCQSVVNGLGTMRNRIGDSHGKGRHAVKPKPRHAELAVNLAGTMASFLIATWKEKTL